jgi:molecular chaperone DnaK (HSP70)
MSGRLAVDFGTSNTVLAVWDGASGEGLPLSLPDFGAPAAEHGVALVPSLIHYATPAQRWVGEQVRRRGLEDADATFRWSKRYVSQRSPVRRRLFGAEVSHADAARDFLTAVLAAAAAEVGLGDEEVALTVPVEAYEHYEDWLRGVAAAAGLPRFRLLDEASAAALGYGARVAPGRPYLVFDFGGGTLDVAVVRVEDEPAAVAGRRCRVLGKAGLDLGGATLDGWLYQEVLRRLGRSDADDDVRPLSRALLRACEAAKARLSTHERADVGVQDPISGATLGCALTRADFEGLLERHEAFYRVEATVRRALNQARERGYGEDDLEAVLLVGGSSLIPAVQRQVQRMFGRERVRLGRPLDAVARGAAAFVAGVDFFDHVQHDYALRHVRADRGGDGFRLLVKRGTPYPTAEPVARLTIKATHDGQVQLGLAVYELGEAPRAGPVEVVFDPAGAARVVELTPDDEERRGRFWLNEAAPTFLTCDPPGRRGEACFEVAFGVDAQKRLVVTARDLRTGRLTHRDFPVVQLS